MRSILDPKFAYTPAARTDIRKTFKRLEREQARAARAAKDEAEANKLEQISKVRVLPVGR